MSLESWSQTQEQEIQEFCETHADSFKDWCSREASAFIRSRRILFGLILYAALTGWNIYRVNADALYAYALPFFALGLAAIFPSIFSALSHKFIDFMTVTTVAGSVYLIELGSQLSRQSQNLPIQLALFVAIALSYRHSTKLNNIRAGALVLFTVAAILATKNVSVAQCAIQIISAYLFGIWMASENLAARRHRFHSIVTNTKQLVHTYDELVKLVPPHVVEMIRDGKDLEKTMPSDPGTACVIAFDIIKSSQIIHPGFFAASNKAKNRCYRILKSGYSADGRESNGYRIKDTGDGFLCSIGYPYGTPDNRPIAEVAHDLAETFSRIFDEEMATLRLQTAPRCAIGMAIGEISGFFPDEEPRQYDLHGRVIMLATRYEAMRNRLMDQDHEISGNIVFISEAVWLGLSDADRQLYLEWKCDTPERRVRDDPEAKHAFYRCIAAASGNIKKTA